MEKLLFRVFFIVCSLFISNTTLAQFVNNPFSQAVDNTSFNFITESPPVFVQTQTSNFDQDAVQMADIGDDGVTVMATFVPNASTVTYDWKVSSEANFDILALVVLDRNRGQTGITRQISGENDWSTISLNIPAGGHWLVWGYIKDSSASIGKDTGWIDNIRIGSTGGEIGNPLPPVNPARILPPIINLLLEEPTSPVIFTVSNPRVVEGDQVVFEIELNEAAENNIGISCAPKDGTAILFNNYEWPFNYNISEPEQSLLSFQIGQKIKLISIPTYSWDTDYGTKSFELNCKQIGTSESSTGIARIFYKPNIRLATSIPFTSTINEGDSFNFEVNIEGDPVTVDTTISYSLRSETAVNGEDYLDETNGTITFIPGETSKTISIKSVDNNSLQRVRELEVTLDQAVTNSEGVDVIQYDTKRLFILDNEPNYTPDVDISVMSPAIGTITEKGPHLWIESAGGEQIGQGFNYIYSQVNSNIQVNSFDNNNINIRVNGASQSTITNESWDIEFESGGSDEIIVGSYIQAYSDSSYNSNENKLRVNGPNSSYCNSTGSFRIFELEKTDTLITKLSADFELYCNGSNKPLRGAIMYDVSLPDATFPPLPLPMGEPYPTLPSLSSSGTVIEIEGAAGDWVTLGASNSFNSSNATFRYTPIANNTGISIDITPIGGSPSSWSIELQRHPLDIYNLNNGRLAVGIYENVTQSQFSDLKPRLEFSNSERRCSSSSGRFRIFEISYDVFGALERLTADIEQACNSGPTSKVSIKYIK